jgi:chloride channel protein, CIC family
MQSERVPRASLAKRFYAFLNRHRDRLLRLRQHLRFSEEAFHLVLAGGIGVVGGLVNLGFFHGAELAKRLIFGADGGWIELATLAGPWVRLGLPILGAAMAGVILHWATYLARFPETGNLLEVVVVGDGRLNFRSAVARALASLLSITTGGSIGREGPITHLSATLASKLGQWARWQPYRLRLLVACGAAAGLAAAYNAPIAGAVFAAQIVLGSFSMSLFAPLVFASVVAAMLSRTFFGIHPAYEAPLDLEFSHVAQLPWFLVLGLAAGGLGAGFLRLLREASGWFSNRFPFLPLRLTVGGLVVGLIAVSRPEVWGNGFETTNAIVFDGYGLRLLIWLLAAKLAATVITVGSGAVGGVFTPTLFLGAALGGSFGAILHHYELAGDLPNTAFALVGMGSLLAATTHSPLLAMILVFEISLNYTLMPPLMIACAVATLSARWFHRDDIYTAPLHQRGIALDRDEPRLGVSAQKTIGDVMQEPVAPVQPRTPFPTLAERFLTSPLNHLPVVDGKGRLVGLVALQDLKQHLGAGADLDNVIAYDVMRPPPACLTPDQRIIEAVPLLLASEQRNVPVVNTLKEKRLVGTVVRPEVLGLVSETLDRYSGRGS